MKKDKFLLEEMKHHDEEAKHYAERNEYDYIWEVPTELFLLRKEYFHPGIDVVDFGCGPAVLIKHILPKDILESINYTGVDISKEMLKIAKKNIPNGKFIHDDMETAKLKANSADIIISLGALHHSQNQIKTIDNWLAILRPGGRLLMREPLYEGLRRGQGESPNEEGIKINQLINHLRTKKTKIESLHFFTSPLFHFVNKVFIKLGFGFWQKHKKIWYPMLLSDVLLNKLLGQYFPLFRGLAFTMEVVKQ